MRLFKDKWDEIRVSKGSCSFKFVKSEENDINICAGKLFRFEELNEKWKFDKTNNTLIYALDNSKEISIKRIKELFKGMVS